MIRILLSLIIISASLSQLTQGQTAPKLQQLEIGQVADLGPEDQNPAYYSLKLASSRVSGGKIATISSISNQRSELEIYIKQWPMDTNQQTMMKSLPSSADFDISCLNQNIVSCLITQVTSDSIFVISLIKLEISSCILLSEIVDVQDLQLFQEEKIANFENGFVQIFKFDLGQFDAESQLQQIVLRADYQSIESVDNKMQYKLFTLQALPQTIQTSQQAQLIRSYSLGAYAKQLKLSAHIPYYIVLISESGQQLSLTSQIPSPYLSLSFPIQYMYISALEQQMTQINQFTFSFDSANLSSQYGLYIEKLTGDGLLKIYACDVSYDYQPLLGSSLYLVIPATVLSCSEPKLGISIANVDVQIAVRILLEPYDQSFLVQNGMLYLSQMRVEVVDSVPSQCISYAVEPIQIDSKQNMFLECKSSIQDFNLTIKTCTISPDQEQPFCRSLTRKFNSSQPNQLYMQKSSQTTEIIICPTSNSSLANPNYYYSILVMAYPQVKKLKFDQPSFQIINSGQLVLYQIDGAVQSKPSLTVEVRARLVNGDIKFSQNCTISINLKSFCHNNDLDMAWAYSASYNFTQLGPEYSLSNVYFGVEGQSQSVYQIVAYVVDHNEQPQPDPPGPTPQPTKHLKLKDGLNEWQLKPGQSLTYTYTSHIIPYSLQIGQNSQQAMICVQVFESEEDMDASAPCSSQQSQIFSVDYTQQVLYIRLTNQQQSNFTFELQINVPNIAISDKSSLLLSCQKSCWSQIKVMYFDWNKESIITSYGSGFINSTPGSNATVLKFISIPFIFTAFLPDGGELYLQAGNNVQVLGQNKSLLKITAYKDLRIIAPIQDISTLLVNAFGRQISAFQRLFTHNKSTSSYSYFEYPSNSDIIVNASLYSSGSIPLYLSKDLPIPGQCRSQQMSCYYTVLITSGEFNFNMLNEDTDIEVAMNSVDNRLFLNVPVEIQSGFGIWYLQPFLLMGDGQGKEDQAIDGSNQAQFNYLVKPMSACGNIQMSMVDNSNIKSNNQFTSTQKGKIGQITSTSGCILKICMTTCQLPFQFTGIPHQVTFTPSQINYTFLYSTSGRQEKDLSLSLGAWGKIINSNTNNENGIESSIDSFIVNVFQVSDVSDCQSKGNVLIATEVMTISEQSIYLNRLHEETITFSGSTTNNLYLVKISASSAVKSTATINIIISAKDEVQTLLPNTALSPLLPQQPLQYQFYSDLYMWELCYITPSSSDDTAQFTIVVEDDFGKNVQKKATFSQDETCFMVVRREIKTGLIRYKINFGLDADVYGHILWVRAKEQVEPVEMRHVLTTLYQPPNLLESLPNGDYGYCIDYSIKTILNYIQIPIIFYPTQRDSISKISLPDKKLVYKEEHIVSSRTKEVIAHKLLFDMKQLQQNFEVCYATESGFYTKALPQSQTFYSVLNEQNIELQFKVQAGQTKKNIFYFNDFDVSNKKQKNQSLIIQFISCYDNFNNNATFFGSSSLQDLILTSSQDFNRILYFQSIKIFHATLKNDDNSYYFAIRNDGQSIPFSLTMYKIKGYQIPQQRWNLTDKKINAFRSEDKNDLIVHLPAAISSKSDTSSIINYTVYIINNDNSTLSAIRKKDLKCPNLKNEQMKQVQIKNMTLTNPKVPIFKINIKQLSGNKFVILANAIIKEDNDSVPLTYFYYDQEVQLNLSDENQSGGGSFRLGVIFGILILAVFLVLLFRIFYKVIRKRMATNTVEFQLSEQERQNTVQNENQSQQPAPVQNSSSVRDSVGYGEFVEEQVAV